MKAAARPVSIVSSVPESDDAFNLRTGTVTLRIPNGQSPKYHSYIYVHTYSWLFQKFTCIKGKFDSSKIYNIGVQ